MPWLVRYFLAAAPTLVPLVGWQFALWAYTYFGCQGGLKGLQPCFIGPFNLLPWLGLGLFWCQLLLWVFSPLSAGLLLSVAIRHYRARRTRSTAYPPSFEERAQ